MKSHYFIILETKRSITISEIWVKYSEVPVYKLEKYRYSGSWCIPEIARNVITHQQLIPMAIVARMQRNKRAPLKFCDPWIYFPCFHWSVLWWISSPHQLSHSKSELSAAVRKVICAYRHYILSVRINFNWLPICLSS